MSDASIGHCDRCKRVRYDCVCEEPDRQIIPWRRHAGKPSYHQYARAVPLRPVTMPPIGFGKKDKR